MSPQSRATVTPESTATCLSEDKGASSCNACSTSYLSISQVELLVDVSVGHHEIMNTETIVENTKTTQPTLTKRASELISSSEAFCNSQPFLSSYGSAFLSGIFADIAQVSMPIMREGTSPSEDGDRLTTSQHLKKKSRMSYKASHNTNGEAFKTVSDFIEEVTDGASQQASHKSSIKIQLFNNKIHDDQKMPIPSLLTLPVTVSSSSFSSGIIGCVTPHEGDDEKDQEFFGWFVSTDDEETSSLEVISSPMFLPHTESNNTYKALSSIKESNYDIEVQRALAADTVDDVLGDLF